MPGKDYWPETNFRLPGSESLKPIRKFESGADRDVADNKLQYEAFLSPIVLREFAIYMHAKRTRNDGTLRNGDNWQKGIPVESYMDSLWRHFMDVWLSYRGFDYFNGEETPDIIEALMAMLFNVQGMAHELLKQREEL